MGLTGHTLREVRNANLCRENPRIREIRLELNGGFKLDRATRFECSEQT